MCDDTETMGQLLRRARQGDSRVLGELLQRHRDRLHRMVRLRIDRRLFRRIDASDVIQEACLEASERFEDYLGDPRMPFFLWLRFLTGQRLLMLHRKHLGVQARDAGREVALYHGSCPDATSAVLAAQLVGRRTSPSQAAARAEVRLRVEEALNVMDPIDREILALRHFEQLTNVEAAQVLEIDESAASKRYVRALKRMKDTISSAIPGRPEVP
jgi:RNA polymerase sigma-70 factor (ECF subfamily)